MLSVMAFAMSDGSTIPCESTGKTVTETPPRSSARQESSTAWCSVACVMMCALLAAAATPLMARLSDSVAPLVKMMSLGLCVDEAGNLFSREINSIFGMPSKGVCAAGGIAKTIFEIGQHRIEYPFIYGCGGVVVEVYGQLSRHIRSKK